MIRDETSLDYDIRMKDVRILNYLKKSPFWRNDSGHFGIMGALSISTLLLFAGVAIDQTRLQQASTELQFIVDAGVLAASIDPDISRSEREEILKKYIVNRISDHQLLKNPNVELSLERSVFDIRVTAKSTSDVNLFFGGPYRSDLGVSVVSETIIDTRTVEIAMVLDISTSMNDARLNEMKAAAKSFIDTLFNSPESERLYVSMVPYGGAVRLPQNFEFLLDPPDEDEEKYWLNGEWNGCFFMEPNDYQNGIPINGKFPYLPSFWTFGGNNGEMNPWCPRPGNEVVGLTQDKEVLFNTIDSFARSDGTVSGIGAAWGLTTLEPEWRGLYTNSEDEDVPFNFEPNRRKIILLMSDGGSSHLLYPRSNDFEDELPFHVPTNGNRRAQNSSAQNNAQQATCNYIVSRGVEIYTVGFQITNGNHIANLRNCASSDSFAFDASAGNLNESFEMIAGQISTIRLSQ